MGATISCTKCSQVAGHTCQVSCTCIHMATNSPGTHSSLHLIVITTCIYVLLQTDLFVLVGLSFTEFHSQ